jgi:hypothetical protein
MRIKIYTGKRPSSNPGLDTSWLEYPEFFGTNDFPSTASCWPLYVLSKNNYTIKSKVGKAVRDHGGPPG